MEVFIEQKSCKSHPNALHSNEFQVPFAHKIHCISCIKTSRRKLVNTHPCALRKCTSVISSAVMLQANLSCGNLILTTIVINQCLNFKEKEKNIVYDEMQSFCGLRIDSALLYLQR